MSKPIMYELYYGLISPWEHKPTQTGERKEVNHKIESEKRYFEQKMSIDDCPRLEALNNLYGQSSSFAELDAFSYGFRLATRLMIDVFSNSPDTTQREQE